MAEEPKEEKKKAWKWFGDLDDEAEKEKAREALSRHPHLRGRKLAWDGRRLLGYERPPTRAWYFQDDEGKWTPGMQASIDSGEVLDTKDGGFLMLVPVAE